jgi:hypothetical protein
MSHPHINWSEVIRATVQQTIMAEGGKNLAEAVLLNEQLRKKAPQGWDSTAVIKQWRQNLIAVKHVKALEWVWSYMKYLPIFKNKKDP